MNIQTILDAFPPAKHGKLSDIDKDATEKAIGTISQTLPKLQKPLRTNLKTLPPKEVIFRLVMLCMPPFVSCSRPFSPKGLCQALAASLADKRPDRVKGFITRQLQVCGARGGTAIKFATRMWTMPPNA